jgi:hypothetical protein
MPSYVCLGVVVACISSSDDLPCLNCEHIFTRICMLSVYMWGKGSVLFLPCTDVLVIRILCSRYGIAFLLVSAPGYIMSSFNI